MHRIVTVNKHAACKDSSAIHLKLSLQLDCCAAVQIHSDQQKPKTAAKTYATVPLSHCPTSRTCQSMPNQSIYRSTLPRQATHSNLFCTVIDSNMGGACTVGKVGNALKQSTACDHRRSNQTDSHLSVQTHGLPSRKQSCMRNQTIL